MATVKNVSSDYTINLDNGSGLMTINGDLDVLGNITYVEELAVDDDFIIVAANNASGGTTSMGMLATRPSTPKTYAGLRFNASANQWEVSSSVDVNGGALTPYAPIATGNAAVAGSNTQIQFNDSSAFGATANLTFDKTTNQLTITGYEVYGNIGSTPSYTGNGVAVYNNTVGSGSTGLYVKNATVNDELISLSKAKLFAIIF
jgi:hypothetical protein